MKYRILNIEYQIFRALIIASAIFLLCENVQSQDTTKRVDTLKVRKKTDTTTVQNFILAENKYSYLSQVNPDTVTRKRFLWYPLKNLDDIFNNFRGYYLKYMDAGQINQLNFNQLDHYSTAVLRNGRPINDMIDGSIDLNLLSRNEISEIELTEGYANSSYNYPNVVNMVERQEFKYRPHTEIAFWQDRYNDEFVDTYFSQSFAKWINFNFGITKHSYDGKYKNSDFDKWLGRFHLNLAPSKKFNLFIYTYYSKIQRGLNEGINPDTVDIGNKEIMFNPSTAKVRNSDAYEIKERFDIDAGAMLLAGKSSFTKLQLYVSNSFKKYRDEENRTNSNGITARDNFHWINYGTKLQQIFNFKPAKNLNLISRSEGEINHIIRMYDSELTWLAYPDDYTENYLSLFENLEIQYNKLELSGFIRGYSNSINKIDTIRIGVGAKGSYKILFDSSTGISFNASYYNTSRFLNGSISLFNGPNKLTGGVYYYKDYIFGFPRTEMKGVSASLNWRIFNFDIEANYNHNLNTEKINFINPVRSGNVSLAYHNTAIRNKLEYKIGLVSKFWSNYYSVRYYGIFNSFIPEINNAVRIPDNATLDFYIIGKIDKAIFGLTFENILDRLIYNTGVYPNTDRGGLANVLSRFNITWYFFD